jgi:hypothetical protein
MNLWAGATGDTPYNASAQVLRNERGDFKRSGTTPNRESTQYLRNAPDLKPNIHQWSAHGDQLSDPFRNSRCSNMLAHRGRR